MIIMENFRETLFYLIEHVACALDDDDDNDDGDDDEDDDEDDKKFERNSFSPE